MQEKPKYPINTIPALARKLANGEVSAIAQIYQLTYTNLVHFGLQVAGSTEQVLVEGVVQDFFIWLAKNYTKVAKIKNFEAYLYQSIRTNIKQKLQANAAKKLAHSRYLSRMTPLQRTCINSPEEKLLQNEQELNDKLLINSQLKMLSTRQREAIYLRFYENRSYKEIAEILSTNAQVARNYVFKALKMLRKKANKLPLFF